MALLSMPRIERLHLADVTLPEGHPAAEHGRTVVVFGFVIDHPDGVIVVDTGVGHGSALIDKLYSPTVTELENAFASVRIDPGSVVAVVNSHLHFDHCGQNPFFYGTDVPVYAQGEEVESARGLRYTVPEWATVPTDQLRAVRGDETIVDGVRLLATPGHTRGHQSVIVEAEDDVVVIAAQSVWDIQEFHNEEASPANVDDEALKDAAVASIRRLKSLDPAVAYFSHHRDVYRRGQ